MVFKEKFYLGYRDIDKNLKIKNSGILNIFEDIAGMHAALAGEGLKNSDTTWLLTGYKVKILERPEHGDKLSVSTWGTEIKNVTAAREFEIRGEDGKLLIIGLSNWVHINLKTRKLERVSDELIEAYELEPERTNFNELKLKKLEVPDYIDFEKEYTIDWNWIDANNHMNNIYYMDLAENIMPEEIRMSSEFSGFEIMYKKEIKYQDKVKCLYREMDDSYIVTVKSTSSEDVHCIVKLYKKTIDNGD